MVVDHSNYLILTGCCCSILIECEGLSYFHANRLTWTDRADLNINATIYDIPIQLELKKHELKLKQTNKRLK